MYRIKKTLISTQSIAKVRTSFDEITKKLFTIKFTHTFTMSNGFDHSYVL